MTRVRSALQEARHARAVAIAAVAAGRLDVEAVLDQACLTKENPLRRITLLRLLCAQPGCGERSAHKLLDRVRVLCGEPDLLTRDMTVSWLLDRRSGGRRYLAWVDAHTSKRLPWPGWPFTTQPAAGAGRAA